MRVHFAGSDGNDVNKSLFEVGIKYRLNSYHYIKKQKAFDYKLLDQYNHSIVDSGLFSLMFGGDKDVKMTYDDFYTYMLQYSRWLNKNNWKNTSFVECDVQKKLGSESAWEFRREMKSIVNKGQIINVYHLEDENPDKLIKFSDYIAISLPELRFNCTDKERWNITKYIATKATLKGKRVHLLGCTEKKYLQYFQFCFSCDSTSWLSPLRYGDIKTHKYKTHIKQLENATDNNRTRKENLCALLHKMDYEIQTGNQE
jgi:hypothetical protein